MSGNAMANTETYNRTESLIGLFVLIGILYLIYIAAGSVKSAVLNVSGYVVYADFVSASGLNVGDPVKIAGVNIGAVESIGLADYQAHVGLRINDDVDIHEDAIASIEPEGLIGDRSVSIEPGNSGKPLGPGEEIKDTQSPLSLPELLGRWLTGDLTSGE